jgi:hypothetical protein
VAEPAPRGVRLALVTPNVGLESLITDRFVDQGGQVRALMLGRDIAVADVETLVDRLGGGADLAALRLDAEALEYLGGGHGRPVAGRAHRRRLGGGGDDLRRHRQARTVRERAGRGGDRRHDAAEAAPPASRPACQRYSPKSATSSSTPASARCSSRSRSSACANRHARSLAGLAMDVCSDRISFNREE